VGKWIRVVEQQHLLLIELLVSFHYVLSVES